MSKLRRAGSMGQVVEHLPGKCEVLNSIPTPQYQQKKKKKERNNFQEIAQNLGKHKQRKNKPEKPDNFPYIKYT
jgi:hypothetical protein